MHWTFFKDVNEAEYGYEDEDLAMDEEDSSVVVPECRFALEQDHVDRLLQAVNPLGMSDNCGKELYQQTLASIRTIVTQNPSLHGPG